MINSINRQLPHIFELRVEDDNLELYTVAPSPVKNLNGKHTKYMKRFKTLCSKRDKDVFMSGMQAVLDIFYTMKKVVDE